MVTETRCMNLLLVEDDDDHAALIRRGLRNSDLSLNITHVVDGVDAVDYLNGRDAYTEGALPDLILLDLNLPRMNGHEVLTYIKSDPALRAIPVIVLTTSDAPVDRQRAYAQFVNSYLVKPMDPTDFQALIHHLGEYWARINTPCAS